MNKQIILSVIVVLGAFLSSSPLLSQAVTPTHDDAIELLNDQFFYEFDTNGQPTQWQVQGSSAKLERGYNSSTGFAVRITTSENAKGFLKQEVDLTREGKEVKAGGVLQGVMHYRSQEPKHPEGAFRLMCQWLNAKGEPITVAEVPFMDNPNLWFDKHKAWGQVAFRTIAPQGAVRFVFAVEIAENCVVEIDDCSLALLGTKDYDTPFISMLPPIAHVEGAIGQPYQGQFTVQSMNMPRVVDPSVSGNSGDITLHDAQLPEGDAVTEVDYDFIPSKKGAFQLTSKEAYAVQYALGGELKQVHRLIAYIIDPDDAPQAHLETPAKPEAMMAYPKQTAEQMLDFNVSGVIESVKVALVNTKGNAFKSSTTLFYYAASKDKLYNHNVKITFAPMEVGEYEAELHLTSPRMEEVVIPIKGTCQSMGDVWTEKFMQDQALDSRFTGEAWNNYHRFDQGYYYLDGAWSEGQGVTVHPSGYLKIDEWMNNGIQTLTLSSASNQWSVEYSVDGGQWQAATAQGQQYTINTLRPTLFRIQNTGSDAATLQSVQLTLPTADQRTTFTDSADAFANLSEANPLAVLEETFNMTRHTRGITLDGWQNVVVRGERPFKGWAQKNKQTQEVEEQCAQISFFQYAKTNDTPHESWLISPLLSAKQAKSQMLTFRLRYEYAPSPEADEQFGVHLITYNAEGVMDVQYVDITKHLLVQEVVPNTWYDYCIDLSQVEGVTIDDLFHVAFSFYAKVGGKNTVLTFMIDDVTYGRTDLPVVKADQEMMQFAFKPSVDCTPQTLNVTVERGTDPVEVILVPKRPDGFVVSAYRLPAQGGSLAVGFSTKSKNARAGALLLQTRGGVPALVKLMATIEQGIAMPDGSDALRVYPTLVDRVCHVEGTYERYLLCGLDGQLIRSGNASEQIDLSTVAGGHYLLRLITADGAVANFRLFKR